jgi:8-amino-7-oxononanoate synthase
MEWNWLIENGVYVNLAVPPGTPQSSSLLRISLSAAHTEADINILLKAFSDLKSNQQELISKMSSRLTK